MLCQRCKKSGATVHVTDLVGEPKELHLCEECAEEEGIRVKSSVPINTILEDFIKHQVASQEMSDLTCPECGTSFLTFRQQGVLGCPHDYEAFDKPLTSLIAQAHEGATRHVGKVPNKASSTQKKQHLVIKLRHQLQEAVEQEKYEEAAKLRDQLKELEDK
ncbi:MAG: UvrB/UvrC motif-containing protein [Phycisphaerales bacterium]|nr:MAG: UvrB/UvrC motif-containing protein [Phycisphaerales bacterium]